MTVKNKQIKKVATKIMEDYPERVSPSFEDNKKVIENLTTITNKKIRNQLAGIITRRNNKDIVTEKTKVIDVEHGQVFDVSCPTCGSKGNICTNEKGCDVVCPTCESIVCDDGDIQGDIIEVIS